MSSIKAWLERQDLGQYAASFESNQIGLSMLDELTDADLKELGVSALGHRKLLLRAIRSQHDSTPAVTSDASAAQQAPNTAQREAERRQLTVMFCDLVGSTALSQQLDPEALRDLMRHYQQCCGAVIDKYEGHVAQYLGDGLMVYFGWPRAHEDDAERALRAALEIVEVVKQVAAPQLLQVRLGCATGQVVVGETGAGDASVPKLAVGETPNLAARMQGLAGADEIVIAPATRHLLGAVFELADMGTHHLKGIQEPVRAWRVTGLGRSEGRFESARGVAGHTPMVGRAEEVALLLRRWELARAGEGQLVLLSGEPGIGKSRTTRALREALKDQPHQQLHFQCSPFHTQSGLHPVITQLQRASDLRQEDSADAKLDKLEALLRQALPPAQVAGVAPLMAALLSLPVARYAELNYSAQKRKERTLAAVLQLLAALAARQPLLLLFEDVHWIDPTTQEFLDLLVPRVAQSPVLLLITHRPEYLPHWAGAADVTQMRLNRLSRKLGAELADRVTAGQALPPEVLEQIMAKTDGVPLFVEELTKAVLESGLLRLGRNGYELTGPLNALAIPSTLQDSLMARLDRLSEVREVAQIGACIGREFGHELLSAVAGLPQAMLQAALAQLADADLIFARGTAPDALYTFKHALVQDAAYASLLRSRRQALHRLVAQALEAHFPERVANEPEAVAQHYSAAGLHEAAVVHWLAAGQRAIERFANAEAVGHLGHGIQALGSLPMGLQRDRTELLLQDSLGRALGSLSGFASPDVGRAYERARQLCGQVGDMAQLLPTLYGLWNYYLMRAEYPISQVVAARFLELTQQAQDPGAKALGHAMSSAQALFVGDFQRTADMAEAGSEHYQPLQHALMVKQFGADPGALCLDWASWSSLIRGYPERAEVFADQGQRLVSSLGDPWTTVVFQVHVTLRDYLWRDPVAALSHARACIETCAEVGMPDRIAEAQIIEGWALAELGEFEPGIELIDRGRQVWQSVGAKIADPLFLAVQATALLRAGRPAEAHLAVEEGLAQIERTGERLMQADLHRLAAEIALAMDPGDGARAQAGYVLSIAVAQDLNSKWFELRAAIGLARLWLSQGRRADALALLTPVYNWFTEGFGTQDLQEARALLDQLAC